MTSPPSQPARCVVAIGASAGGIEALQRMLRELPEDFPGVVCLVLHIPATSRSLLAEILDRQTPLPVTTAVDGEPMRAGHIYVAPPDRHLRVRGGRVCLDRGPKENGVRPAIDTLLRSVAQEYGQRALAVVLSGSLSDGAGGAAAVAAAGGTVFAQHAEDALVPSMPDAAAGAAPDALRLTAPEIAKEVTRRAAVLTTTSPEEAAVPTEERRATAENPSAPPKGPPTALTCPECHGPLWELEHGELVRFRCRVGHVFGEDILLEGKNASVETALWMAVEALEERSELLARMADRLAVEGRTTASARTRERARGALERAELIRGVLGIDDAAGDAIEEAS